MRQVATKRRGLIHRILFTWMRMTLYNVQCRLDWKVHTVNVQVNLVLEAFKLSLNGVELLQFLYQLK